jgi:Phosphotransferase enzyme family
MTLDLTTKLDLQAFLIDYLGTEYNVVKDEIGFSSEVLIYRSKQTPDRGVVLKIPRTVGASVSVSRESRRSEILASVFPIKIEAIESGELSLPSFDVHIPPHIRTVKSSSHGFDLHINQLLPGINGAQYFSDLTSKEKEHFVQLLAQCLAGLHSVHVPTEIKAKLQFQVRMCYRDVLTSTDEVLPHSGSSRPWLKQIFDSVVFQDTKTHIEQKEATDAHDEKIFNLICDIKTFLDKPETDPFWDATCSQLVLTHGDYMLPNVLFLLQQIGKASPLISGLVDLSECGMNDRRFDLASCIWSIKYNCKLCGLESTYGEKLAAQFLHTYNAIVGVNISIEDLVPWRALYVLSYE